MTKDEVRSLAAEGADEFFCGYAPLQKLRSSCAYLYLNGRPSAEANFTDRKDFTEALALASSLHKPVFLTINASAYSGLLYAEILRILGYLDLRRPNGVIVSDPGLILLLRRRFPRLRLVASTICPIFNVRALAFYKNMGIDRVTFSVALKATEIANLARAARCLGLETECFIANEQCPDSIAFCSYLHGSDLAPHEKFCALEKRYEVKRRSGAAPRCARALKALADLPTTISDGCGACYLARFIAAGVDVVKMSGRGLGPSYRMKHLRFVKRIVDLNRRELRPRQEHVRRIFTACYGYHCGKKCVYS